MNERLRLVRDHLDLTRAEFGARIGVSGDVINNLERGRVEIKEPIIKLLDAEFNVSELWLRTGKGEMFNAPSREDEITAFIDDVIDNSKSDFRFRLVSALAHLNTEQWKLLENIALTLMGEQNTKAVSSEARQTVANMPEQTRAASPSGSLYIAARDGSRLEAEVNGDITIPEDDSELP